MSNLGFLLSQIECLEGYNVSTELRAFLRCYAWLNSLADGVYLVAMQEISDSYFADPLGSFMQQD